MHYILIEKRHLPATAPSPALYIPEDPTLLLAQEDEEDARLLAMAEEYEINGRSYVDND
jgi:hypothetical protein